MAEGESRLTIENSEQVIRIGFLDRNILEEAAIQNIGDQVADLIDTTPNPKLLMDFADEVDDAEEVIVVDNCIVS